MPNPPHSSSKPDIVINTKAAFIMTEIADALSDLSPQGQSELLRTLVRQLQAIDHHTDHSNDPRSRHLSS